MRRLETLAQRLCGKPLAALTSLDASGLIDALLEMKAGQLNPEILLDTEAPWRGASGRSRGNLTRGNSCWAVSASAVAVLAEWSACSGEMRPR